MLAVLVVILAVGGVYMQALGGPFLWDDRALVLDAPLVEQSASLAEYLRHPFWMGGGAQALDKSYYRPLVTLSFAFDHRVHGANPGGYHLTNLVVHVGCALLLLALLRRGGARDAVAALVTCAWALLPRLAEAAAWISGRTDLLATFFVLAALSVWGESLGRRVASALLFGVGLLAKESAIALLFALAVGEWLRAEAGARSLERLLSRVWPLIASLLLYGVVRLSLVGFDAGETLSLGVGRRSLVVLQALGTYAGMLLDPFRPRAVIGRVGALSAVAVLGGAVVAAGALITLVRTRKRLNAGTAQAATLAFGALVPVLHLVPIPLRTLAADRFLYLPTAGLALALAPLLDTWLGAARLRWGGAVGIAVALASTTLLRVGVWSDELEFWIRTYLETPALNNAPATELFGVYYRAGLSGEALTLAERALRYDDPNKRTPRYNSALCLMRLGNAEEAARRFRASRTTQRWKDADTQLAILEMQAGRVESARALLEPISRTGDAGARTLLGRLPELARARSELLSLGASGEPEQRARLASLIGDDRAARSAWTDAVRRPGASRELLAEALSYLVHTGDRAAIELAARAYLGRFGALDPELGGIVEVRLSELERLLEARSRVGLDGSAVELVPVR